MKHKQNNPSSSDAWKKMGIAAVLIVAAFGLLLFLNEVGNSGNMGGGEGITGLATKIGQLKNEEFLGQPCEWEGGDPSQYYVTTKFKDATGKSLNVPSGWESINLICCPNKNGCIGPNGCTKGGKVLDDSAYFCEGGKNGDTTFVVCDAKGKGKLSEDKVNNGLYDGRYYCDGSKWVSCSEKGQIVKSGSLNLYCDGEVWHKVKQKGTSCNALAASDLKKYGMECYEGYGGTETCEVPSWHITEPYEQSGRVACCAETNQCAKADGSCVPVGTVVGDLVCDQGMSFFDTSFNPWSSAKITSGQYVTGVHGGGKHITDGKKWVKCESKNDGQTMKPGSISYTCKNGKWLSPEKCKSCSTGENCVFSDEYEKISNNPSVKQSLLKLAEEANRVACGKSTQCITAAGGTVDYDKLSGDATYVCGDSNRWLKCASKAKNVVSDGGNNICDGSNWKKIDNEKKGCTNCAKSEACVASNLYSTYNENKGDWGGLEWAYSTKRAGCTAKTNDCVDKAGVGWPYDARKDGNNICDMKNEWHTCSASAFDQVSSSGTYICVGGGVGGYWSSCGTTSETDVNPGGMLGQGFLCGKTGWKTCASDAAGILESDTSFVCVNQQWTECNSETKGSLILGLYSCDGKTWTYVPPSLEVNPKSIWEKLLGGGKKTGAKTGVAATGSGSGTVSK